MLEAFSSKPKYKTMFYFGGGKNASCGVASCELQLRVASGELPVAMENSVDSSSVFSKL